MPEIRRRVSEAVRIVIEHFCADFVRFLNWDAQLSIHRHGHKRFSETTVIFTAQSLIAGVPEIKISLTISESMLVPWRKLLYKISTIRHLCRRLVSVYRQVHVPGSPNGLGYRSTLFGLNLDLRSQFREVRCRVIREDEIKCKISITESIEEIMLWHSRTSEQEIVDKTDASFARKQPGGSRLRTGIVYI